MNIPSYPKVHALGHARIPDLLDGEVFVQEKYDGSQFSWAWDSSGNLHARSKGKVQYGDGGVTDQLFAGAVDYLVNVSPSVGWVFRGEWFAKPRHNVLAYPRKPKNGLVLYDAEDLEHPSVFGSEDMVATWAERLDIEAARSFGVFEGGDLTLDILNGFLANESSLGGPLEGVVVKNYSQFTRDGKVQMGKLVRDQFKEKHKREWKAKNRPVVEMLAATLNTQARWEKAVGYLRDAGELAGEPKDIGPLMRRVKEDTLEEEIEWITEQLVKDALPKLGRMLGRGLPEWYKAKLADAAFEK